MKIINPLKTELNPTCHLELLGAHHIFHVRGLRVKRRTIRFVQITYIKSRDYSYSTSVGLVLSTEVTTDFCIFLI